MKKDPARRPLKPRADYRGGDGYPSVPGVSRRGFLGQALAGTAAVAGAALVADEAVAVPAWERRKRVALGISGWHYIPGTSLRPEKVDVFTHDKAFADWLKRLRYDAKLQASLFAPIKRATAKTIENGKKILQLEMAIGRAIVRHYRQRTGRRTARPDVMLAIGERRIRTMGIMVRPYRPIRRPTVRP